MMVYDTCVLRVQNTILSSILLNTNVFLTDPRDMTIQTYKNVIVKSLLYKTMTMRMQPRSSDSGSRRFAEHPRASNLYTQPAVNLHINIISYDNIPIILYSNKHVQCSVYVQYVYCSTNIIYIGIVQVLYLYIYMTSIWYIRILYNRGEPRVDRFGL